MLRHIFKKKKQNSEEQKKDEESNIDTFLKKSVQENVDKNGIFKVGYVEASIYLSYGGDAFVQDEKGNTLAHIYPQLTEKLIEKGVDINQKNDEGYTPAMCAAIKNQLTVDLIKASSIESLNQVYPNGETVLTAYLSQSGYKEKDVLFALFEKGVDVNQKNQKGMSPLDYMSSYLFEEVAESMIKQGLDVENATYKNKPLSFYLMISNPDLFLKIENLDLKQKDDKGNSLLHYWATDLNVGYKTSQRSPAILNKLLQKIDINLKNNQGETPLISALKKGHYTETYMCHDDVHCDTKTREPQARILIEKGADVLLFDNEGNTPLHHAARAGLLEMLPLLIKKGASVFALNKEGKRAKDYIEGIAQEYLKLVERSDEFESLQKRVLLHRSLSMPIGGSSRVYDN